MDATIVASPCLAAGSGRLGAAAVTVGPNAARAATSAAATVELRLTAPAATATAADRTGAATVALGPPPATAAGRANAATGVGAFDNTITVPAPATAAAPGRTGSVGAAVGPFSCVAVASIPVPAIGAPVVEQPASSSGFQLVTPLPAPLNTTVRAPAAVAHAWTPTPLVLVDNLPGVLEELALLLAA